MSTITQDVVELRGLDLELKSMRKRMRLLSQQKNRCEARILEYLEVNEQPGLKFEGITIIAKPKQRRRYENKKNKRSRGEAVLEQMGVADSGSLLDEVMEAMRGSPVSKPSLTIY